MLKKFLVALICAFAFNFFSPVQSYAEDFDVATDRIEKFYSTLPVAKNYKVRQRPILIQGAMNVETEIFVRALKNPVAYRDMNYFFVAGTYKNYPVVIARTEQGMTNTAVSTTLAIKKFDPVAVINQGTAGSHVAILHVNYIVVGAKSIPVSAYKSAYSPEGAGIDFTAQEMRGTYAYDEATKTFTRHGEYFTDPKLFNIAFAVANTHGNFNAVSGTIATSDRWINWVDGVKFLHEKYGTSCEEMETVAAAQICHNAGIPFLGVRVISNNVITGENFSYEAADTCQKFVLLVVENYINKILRGSKS